MKTKRRLVVSGLLLAASALLVSTPVNAEPGDLSLGGELGVGTVLSKQQRDLLGYSKDVQGSVRLGVNLSQDWMLQAAVSTWWFPSSPRGYGRDTMFGLGLRFEPMIGDMGRLVIDTHQAITRTGGLQRFGFDAGLGFEFAPARCFGVGPMLRYGQVRSVKEDATDDAKFWSIGVGVTIRMCEAPPAAPVEVAPLPPPPPPPAPADADGDGVVDPDDACPMVAAGAHPDPAPQRRGCPAPDTDNDGITDDVDACPNEAAGQTPDPERPGCPDGDNDKDGVLNHQDQCPNEPAGLLPDPARPGCAAPDKDHDSIPDTVDACPDKPGAPSKDPKKNGCPGLVLIESGQIKINKPVFFATGKEDILKKSDAVLEAVGTALASTPSIKKVLIEGHTDNVGKADANLALSQRRADGVKAWLVKSGIDAGRLEAKGFGDTRPLQPNTSSAGRAENRRVQFTIIDPPQSAPATGAKP